MTFFPDSRRRVASRVKSESEETIANASTFPIHSRSIASMMSAESVEFFPVVYANCCTGWIAHRLSSFFHPDSCVVVQSPYARLMVGVP